MSFFPIWQENKLFTTVLSLVCLALFVFLGVKTYSSVQATRHLDKPVPVEHTIVIEGLGKANMSPDIAVMTFGISSTAKSVSDAQKQNTALMNTLIAKIKDVGIVDADLQTKDYSAYEKTEWNAQTQKSESAGWIVSQSLDVKIRDVQKVSTIVEIGGQNGSTSISGPVFTIDDQTAYEATARQKALADARQKADSIAQSLGLKIDHVVSYNEYNESTGGPMPYLSAKDVGGGIAAPAPMIQSGTQELRLHSTVTYLLSN
ncbi:MAG: SIMPL domain-containing protein [Candidatus Uhrbacteria bacterium]|nr:SIMPL domain-containing protein [Candidatus Uhrbacteria bacterium]